MSGGVRISESQARDILARAAEIDRTQSQLTTVDALRAAAREAGIADSAFDEALQEIQRVEVQQPRPRRRWRVLVGVALSVLLLGLLLMFLRPAPLEERAAPASTAPARIATPAPTP